MDTRTVAGTAPAWSRWGAPDPGRLFSGRWYGRVGGARGRWRVHGGALLLGPLMFRWTTCVRLDHLRAVGPPGSRNRVVQRNISGPSGPAASRHARHRPTMRDGRWGGAGAGVGTAPPPEPSGSRVLTTRASRTADPTALQGPAGAGLTDRRTPRRRGPRGNYHTKRRTRDPDRSGRPRREEQRLIPVRTWS